MRLTSIALRAPVAATGCRCRGVLPVLGRAGELDGSTRAVGVKRNPGEALGERGMGRLRGEGAASPADVILTGNALTLWRAGREAEGRWVIFPA